MDINEILNSIGLLIVNSDDIDDSVKNNDCDLLSDIKSLKYWIPNGFRTSTGNEMDTRRNNTLDTNGTDQTKTCKYTYNSLGFRGDEITKPGFKVMSIGCSHTEGVGVNDNETWPSIFSKKIPEGVDLNFGMGGRSNDYIARALITFYDEIKPDLVMIMYTYPNRSEFYTKDGGIEPYSINKWGYFANNRDGVKEHQYITQLSNIELDLQNWYKNHLLIKYFLETKKCNWLWNGYMLDTNYTEYNRFDAGFGKYIDFGSDKIHNGPKHNQDYANKLYDHICQLFPNWLTKTPNS
jgi:hypothetical protein